MTRKKSRAKPKQARQPKLVQLDLGCGKNKIQGFIGVDVRAFPGVDVVLDLGGGIKGDVSLYNHSRAKKWPWADGSVDQVHCSHFLEHLTPAERVHFVNELHRVLKKDGVAQVRTPYAWSDRAFGDLTHQFPPVVGMWFQYLRKEWRDSQAPHNDFYTCDFDVTWWPDGVNPALNGRDNDHMRYAFTFYKESFADMVANLRKL